MTDPPWPLLTIVDTGLVAKLAGGNEIRLGIDSDAKAWKRLRGQLAGYQPIPVIITNAATFELVLPEVPRGRRQLWRCIGQLAPVLPDQLIWTEPRPGGSGEPLVTLVRRSWLEPRILRIEAKAGLVLRPVAERNLAPFLYCPPLERRRFVLTISVIALSLGVVAVSLGIAGQQKRHGVAAQPASAAAQTVFFERPGFAATLARAAVALPQHCTLAAIVFDRSGGTNLELNTADPDQLRSALAGRELAPGFVETGHVRLMGTVFRVTFRRAARPRALATGLRTAPPLAAPSLGRAQNTATQHVSEQARSAALDLRLEPAPAQPDMLMFAFVLTGPQAAVLTFADHIESTPPVIRLIDWRLDPDPSGVRLSGTMAVPWARAS